MNKLATVGLAVFMLDSNSPTIRIRTVWRLRLLPATRTSSQEDPSGHLNPDGVLCRPDDQPMI